LKIDFGKNKMRRIFTGSVGVVERFGRYNRILPPGLQFYIPFVEKVTDVPTNITHLHHEFPIKTRDNIFADVQIDVFWKVTNPYDYSYAQKSPRDLILATLGENIRSAATSTDLDELFKNRDLIQRSISENMRDIMEPNGMSLSHLTIAGIEPDAQVRKSMNAVSVARREKEAASERAEAEKVKIVKEAEAEAERMELRGRGISAQRRVIVEGLRDSVQMLSEKTGVHPNEAVIFALVDSYFEKLGKIGESPNSKVLIIGGDTDSAAGQIAKLRAAFDQSSVGKL
jgi:regulator of protease activity HflC (stomatin/prohibitin superfamily)